LQKIDAKSIAEKALPRLTPNKFHNSDLTENQGRKPLMTTAQLMIVDDSKLTRLSLKTTLNKINTEVTLIGEAEDGQQAVEMAQIKQPDIILMDIGMPLLDGVQATKQIRQLLPDVKIIMLTSREDNSDVLDAFQCGATSYCLKETDPDTLIRAIRITLGGACWIDPKIAHVLIAQARPQANPMTPTVPTAIPVTYTSPRQPETPVAQHRAFTPSTSSTNENPIAYNLSEREIEVLRLITEGLNNTEITERLSISMNTLKTHIKNTFLKLGVEDRTAAALKALREHLV
jgi:NarL family two-component system response regulator LiaR